MRTLLAGLCLLYLTMSATGQDVSGRVGEPKGLIPVEDGVVMRDGIIYPNKEAADAADKKIRDSQPQASPGADARWAGLKAAGAALRDEEDRKFEARLWGLGIVGALIVARVFWGLVGRRTGRAEPSAATDPVRDIGSTDS